MKTLLLLSILLLSCAASVSQHSETNYGVIRVALGEALDDADPWLADERTQIVQELRELGALGPTFVLVSPGASVVDVTLRPFNSGQECASGVGRFHVGSHYVEVDPECTQGYDELKTAVGHEIGHWLGLQHICQHPGDARDCDARAGYGVALMNPHVSYDVLPEGHDLPPDAFDDQTYSQDAPTSLDLAEFRLARGTLASSSPR